MKRVLAALVLTSACSSAPPPVAPAPIQSACTFGALTQPGACLRSLLPARP